MSEIRQVVRSLRKQPGHTAVAVLAFGLAIAANTAIFSVTDVLVFHPLDLPEIERLVTVHGGPEGTKFADIQFAPADYFDLQQQARTLSNVAALHFSTVNLTDAGEPERVQSVDVTPNFLEVMGVAPWRGAAFDPRGERAEVMLGYDFWQRRFAGADVIGQKVRLNGVPHTVVAVAPPALRYPTLAQVWRPMALTPAVRANRTRLEWNVVGRLRPGVSEAEAANELQLWGRQLARDYPDTHRGRGATVFPFRDMISGAFTAEFMRLTLGAMALLMAMACANVANLQVARISARTREFSLRQALGGSRWRIAANVLGESLVLGLGGLLLGAFLAMWMIDLMRGNMPPEVEVFLPGWHRMGLDWRALWYASALSIGASLVAGGWPAWRASGLGLGEALKDGGRNMSGPERGRLRNVLVVVQVALALVLLAGGLLIAKGAATFRGDIGRFDAARALTACLILPPDKYPTATSREQFTTRLLERLRESPGVAEAAVTTTLPYSSDWRMGAFEREGFLGRPNERPQVLVERTDAQLLPVLRVPLRRGRLIEPSDTAATARVAVVNQALADRYFAKEDAIGRRFRLGGGEWVTIVGVSSNYLHDWILRHPQPMVYLPYAQSPDARVTVVVRPRSGAAAELAGEVRRAVAGIDGQQPLYAVRTFEKAIRDELVGLGYLSSILGVAGVMSLLLSAAGLFSLLSFVVSERTREVGLRMALGASQRAVLGMVLGKGLTLMAIGLAIGVTGAAALGRLLSEMVFGTEAVDPWVLGGGSLVLLAVGLAACYWPARRATLVDPMVALRQE